jgi:hypothetical protein
MNEALPNATRIYKALTDLHDWAQAHRLDEAKDRLHRMRISGQSARMGLTGGVAEAPLPPDADEKITTAMAGQMVNALEGSIQIAHAIKARRNAPQETNAIEQLRVIHSWAHDLSDAKKLPLAGKKLGSAKHKIDYLGNCLQQIEFGGRSMSAGNAQLGARYPSSFAGRTGDAMFQRELERDELDEPGRSK